MDTKYLRFVLLIPLFCGILLLALGLLDLSLFKKGIITARMAVGIELIPFLAGILSSFLLAGFSLLWLFKKQWLNALLAVLSIISFAVLFAIAGAQGIAIIYAT